MRRQRNNAESWHRSDGGVWLPGAAGAADVPRVAGDPLRGAGMVRRGMGFGFEPAGCCCGDASCVTCTLCRAPCVTGFTLEIPAFPESGCEDAEGTWFVPFVGQFTTYCMWQTGQFGFSPDAIQVTINEDRAIRAYVHWPVEYGPDRWASWIHPDYFSGSPPWPCDSISNVELQFDRAAQYMNCGLSGSPEHSVFVTASTT